MLISMEALVILLFVVYVLGLVTTPLIVYIVLTNPAKISKQ